MQNNSTNLVEFYENEYRISHRIMAQNTNNKQKNVLELIVKYKTELQLFGHLPFQTESVRNSVGAVNQEKTYFLNEPQATLLLTFMRNNEVVINFKVHLVQNFYQTKNLFWIF